MANADLRSRIEQWEGDPSRKLAQAERSSRYADQVARLTGLDLAGELEPSHALVDLVFQMVEENQMKYIRWEQCAKRDGSQNWSYLAAASYGSAGPGECRGGQLSLCASEAVLFSHRAPPCGICSRARERKLSWKAKADGVKEPKPLRSGVYPEGLPTLTGTNLRRV